MVSCFCEEIKPKSNVTSPIFIRYCHLSSKLCLLQVAEKILNNKELEFYKWDGDLSQLLHNVRDKLNKVAEVSFLYSHGTSDYSLHSNLLWGMGNRLS